MNAPGPAIPYHGVCLILCFQLIWFCWTVSYFVELWCLQ